SRTATAILLGLWVAGLVGGIVYWTFWGDSGFASAKPVPDVTMQTIQGEPYSLRDPAGKVRLLSFIYTRCPDICPMTTVKMVEL
ncbi:SCO family protein, partial [Frankia sp. Cpl3]|nr:SCO family protein [Frankia sp. Cpl3]